MANRTIGQVYVAKFAGESAATELVLSKSVAGEPPSWVFVVPTTEEKPAPLMANQATLRTSGGREIPVSTRRTSGRLQLFLKPKAAWKETLQTFGLADGETFVPDVLAAVAVPPVQHSLASEPEEQLAAPKESVPGTGTGLAAAPLFAASGNAPARAAGAGPVATAAMSAEEIEKLVASRVAEAMQSSGTVGPPPAGSRDLFAPSATAVDVDIDSLRRQLGPPGGTLRGAPPKAGTSTEAAEPAGEPSGASMAQMMALLQQMQQMQMRQMMAPTPGTAGGSMLDVLATGHETTGLGTTTPGARGIAALEKMRSEFRKNPRSRYEHVRAKIRDSLRSNDGQDETAIEAYFEKFVPFHDDLTPYFVTLFAEIIVALERQDTGRALGVASGGLQFLEQRALDGDALDLAWLCTLLEDPLIKPKEVPASAGKGGQGRRGRDGTGAGAGRRAFARTIEPAVLTAVSAAMKDWDALDKLRASQA